MEAVNQNRLNSVASDLKFIDLTVNERNEATIAALNPRVGKYIFMDVLEETENYLLISLWEEERELGLLPLFKSDSDLARILKEALFDELVNVIWRAFETAQAALKLFDSKFINQIDRYASKLNLIAEAAAIITVKTVALIYADRARIAGRDQAGVEEWAKTGIVPAWSDRAWNNIRLGTLDWLANTPGVAERLRANYWRTVMVVALNELKARGTTPSNTDEAEFKRVLTDWIFESDESSASVHAISLCARAMAITELRFDKIVDAVLDLFRRCIRDSRRVSKKTAAPLLVFERESILPFGDIEEYIRMQWQCAGKSDLEILQGGWSGPGLSLSELDEEVRDAQQVWRNNYNFLQNAMQEAHADPVAGSKLLAWVFQEGRRRRRYLRSRWGIDIARRRLLRKAQSPVTARQTVVRAMQYAETMAFDAAADAIRFTVDWLKTKFSEKGVMQPWEQSGPEIIRKAIIAAVGVIEAMPLFHLAIWERTEVQVIRDAETCYLSGIGAHIRMKYPRLRNIRPEKLSRLLNAVPIALSERRKGEPLIRGRRSLRNQVARLLEDSLSKPKKQVSLDAVENRDKKSGGRAWVASPIEAHVLAEEVRYKIAQEISRAKLSAQQRLILEMKLLSGMSKKEIADKLQISEGQVNAQRARAYKKAPHLRITSH